MTIQGIGPQVPNITRTPATSPAEEAGFGKSLANAIENVQQLGNDANQQVQQLVEGNGQDIHRAMISVEKSDLAFEMMLQVRNKIVSAYQEISRMQF